MTKRTNKKIVFLSLSIFLIGSLFFFTSSALAGCQSANMTCSGTIINNPGIEKNCVSDEVWCEPATFPTGGSGFDNGSSCSADSDCASGNCDEGIGACADKSATSRRIGDLCTSGDECPSGVQCLPLSTGSTKKTCQLASTSGAGNSNGSGSGSGAAAPSAAGNGWSLNSVSGFGLPSGSILGIISGILTWLLGALGLLGVIGFTISGILYLTSTGDETMIERAKNAMTWSIVGVIVGLIGVVIIQAIDWMLRGFSNF